MELLQRHQNIWIILDHDANDVLVMGAGVDGLRAALEFLNRLRLAELANELAGWAY